MHLQHFDCFVKIHRWLLATLCLAFRVHLLDHLMKNLLADCEALRSTVNVVSRDGERDIVGRDFQILNDVVERLEFGLFKVGHFVLEFDDAPHDRVEQDAKGARFLRMNDLVITAVQFFVDLKDLLFFEIREAACGFELPKKLSGGKRG